MTDTTTTLGPTHRGGRQPEKIDPQDRAQLAESPVSLRRVAGLFRPHTRTVAVVTAIIVAISVVSMAQPFLLRAVIDDALPHQDVRLLLWAVGGMLAVTVVSQLLGVVQTWLTTSVGQRVMHGLRTDVFRHLQRQSVAFFTRTRSGEVQSRLTHDISGMQSVITSTATSIASNLTTAVATAIAMVALSPRLSLLSLLVIPPAVLMTRKVALLRRDITAQRQRRLADLHSQVEEGLTVSGATLVKTLGAGEATADRFAATSTDLIDLELRSQLAGRWRMATMQIIFAAIPALIYLAAGLPATSGGMTIGTLIAFTTLQAGIFRPLMGLLDVGAQWVTSTCPSRSRLPPIPLRCSTTGCAARCASRASPSATTPRPPPPRGRMPSPTSRSTCPRARRWPSSVRPARASRASPVSSRGCTTRSPGA